MSDKFTLGPWLQTGRTVYALNDSGYNSFYCSVQDAFMPESELLANAQLIAAAPDMLDALQAILPFIPTTKASDGGACKYSANVAAADMVRAAIAKATKDAK